MIPVFTAVFTAREHGCHFGHPCSRAVLVKSIVVMMWVDLFFSSDSSDDDDDNVVVVKTSVGEVRGRVVSASFGHVTDVTVDQYLGIPFAVPPVGQLRYADPIPLDRLPSGTLTPLRLQVRDQTAPSLAYLSKRDS